MELLKLRWGRLRIRKIAQDGVGLSINDDIMEFFKSIDIKGKNVIDGGSNIGVYSLVLSKMVGKGMVYAFEIQPTIYKIACLNAETNKKKNIINYNNALSNKSGESVGFSYIDYEGENISSVGVRTEVGLKGEPHCGEIKTIAVDDLNISNIGLVKLDLEGHEPQALDGMWKTIDRGKPFLLIELSRGYLGDINPTIERIKSHGYSVKELADSNFVFEPT